MSLKVHAEQEMKLAGLYDKDADYDGMIPQAVMALVEAHSAQGHSGMSHAITLEIFNKVINYKTLTPINSDPSTWMEIEEGKLWQSKRAPSFFSKDGGKTWYDLDNMPQPETPP